jgi:hypothetical protein
MAEGPGVGKMGQAFISSQALQYVIDRRHTLEALEYFD